MNTPTQRVRLARPDPPLHDPQTHRWTYHGQHFTDAAVRCTAEQFTELLYLRDLARFHEQELRGYEAWERSINEALNTGDGSYRP